MADRDRPSLVLLAAGGTGGHLFPAESLAVALARRGIVVDLATDHRATRYGTKFPAREIHVVRSDTFRSRNPLSLAKTATVLGFGFLNAWRLLGRLRPAAVVGFGGYPTLPPLMAASFRGIPTIIHEQNAVMGRANRLLAPRVTGIATSFSGVAQENWTGENWTRENWTRKATFTGNPVRPAVIAAAGIPYDAPTPSGPLRLVVFGGSQGARIMADIVPPAIERLDPALRARLSILQQARDEDVLRVQEAYQRLGVDAEVAPFFADLPARIAAGHLIVSRAGASTTAELAAIGRPAILVPLPHALDQDQRANAGVLEQAGGAIRVSQDEFTPELLAGAVAGFAAAPERLTAMSVAAKSAGAIDAAERLADLVERIAGVKGTP